MIKESIKYLLSQALHELSRPDCVPERVEEYLDKAKAEIRNLTTGDMDNE